MATSDTSREVGTGALVAFHATTPQPGLVAGAVRELPLRCTRIDPRFSQISSSDSKASPGQPSAADPCVNFVFGIQSCCFFYFRSTFFFPKNRLNFGSAQNAPKISKI